MLTDLILASLHHLLLLAIIAMLATQSSLLRGRVDAGVMARLAGVDRGYGLCAMTLLVVGFARLQWGIKGMDFYLHNPWFHAKIGCFLLAGLISIRPTLAFLRWRRALHANPAFLPDAAQVAAVSRLVRVELVLLAAIVVFAAMMARFGGF